uniref:DUF148 domain-containing protein n=1 Tax=Parastrongyloides trichosuri TaxID=131310 RepID=A0A0N4ZCG7_PARTI
MPVTLRKSEKMIGGVRNQQPNFMSSQIQNPSEDLSNFLYNNNNMETYQQNNLKTNVYSPNIQTYPSNTVQSNIYTTNSYPQQMIPMSDERYNKNFYDNKNLMELNSLKGIPQNIFIESDVSKDINNNIERKQFFEETYNNIPLIDRNEKLDIKFPTFLEGVDQEIVNEFLQIISLKNETYANKQKRLDDLVLKLDIPHQQLYKEYTLERDNQENSYRSKVDSQIETMTPEAQQKFTQISSILTNYNIPDNEKWSHVLEIYNTLSDTLKQEFEKKFENFKV